MEDYKSRGPVSFGLLSLQLQIKTLLEDCGGVNAVELLDLMSDIPGAELRAGLMKSFIKVAKRLVEEGRFPESVEGRLAADLEEELYKDILAMLHDKEIEAKPEGDRTFEVLEGGKSSNKSLKPKAQVVDIEEMRRARQTAEKPLM